ncbi:MAG: type VI secretion system protein TssA, partial [Rhodospirillales bacterium]|nr:type VI secretion system protein TssA [Rhodospirillales bacterium]
IALCAQTLRLRSKDLQVACWLVEALVHRHGFAGLAWGLDLLAGLCTTFWPDLYPAIEEDDNSARLAPLEWLNGKLPPSLKQLPLTRGGSGGTSPALGWDAYLNARRLDSARQRDPKLIAEGGLAAFDDAAATTPTPFYQTLHRNLRGATEARQRLQDILDERCGRLAPSLAGLADATAEIANWVEIVLMQRHALPAEPPSQWPAEAAVPGDEDYPDLAAGISAPAAGPITSRDDAYARLAEIADYLQRTEPHSPAPYLLRRILAWARMPLSELLVDMARGQKDLQAVLDLLGDGRRG